jgi:hypothetical protein
MPRRERKQSGTGIYHVMLRGINRQDIFEEGEDNWSFIRILSAVQADQGDRFLILRIPFMLII